MDCHRHWESILFGAIPIVVNSTLYSLFKESPFHILKMWSGLTRDQFLNFKVAKTSRKAVMIQYWFDKIEAARGRVPTVVYD